MNKMEKTIAFMELPFATQQPAIFLNQSIVTPCLKPANDFSLHKIKFRLLIFIYKVRTGWFGSSNLSLFAPLFIHSKLVFSGPLALGPLYLCTCTLLLTHSSQISSWWSATYSDLHSSDRALQWPALTTMAKAEAPTHSSDMILFLFFKTLISIWNQFICSHVYHLCWPPRT